MATTTVQRQPVPGFPLTQYYFRVIEVADAATDRRIVDRWGVSFVDERVTFLL